MKRLIIVCMLVAICGVVSTTAVLADCADYHYDCYTKDGKKLGSDYVRMCWSWRHAECWPCYCNSDDYKYCNHAYEAEWCNKLFSECNGDCWACFANSNICADKNGDIK